MLDIEECEHARVRRDRRYDGRFFSGVRTTRIYCRPVCPVRPAQGKNVTFYPTAAAAEAAGFRSADSMSRAFKRRFGLVPSAYAVHFQARRRPASLRAGRRAAS